MTTLGSFEVIPRKTMNFLKNSPLLTELKTQFHLGISLAKVNFKLRNEGSLLGILWYLLEPGLFFVTLIAIRGHFSGSQNPYYPLYLIIGLTLFNFFRNVTTQSTRAIAANEEFVKSIKIPLEPLVLSILFQFIFTHLIEIIIVALCSLYFHLPLTWIFYYPLILVVLSIFTLGLSFLLATIGTFIDDLSNVWRLIMQTLWLITPIFYIMKPESLIYTINLFNPMFYFITTARSIIIYGHWPGIRLLAAALASSIISLAIGLSVFRKYKIKFAESI